MAQLTTDGTNGDKSVTVSLQGKDTKAPVKDFKNKTDGLSGLVRHFVQTWPDSKLLSHSAVLRLWRLELTLQSLSPVLALYDPFGVYVPLNCYTTSIKQLPIELKESFMYHYGGHWVSNSILT